MASSTDNKITLYTSHICPWAHRAHIVLSELGLPFEEVLIDLNKPRDPSYLQINPRGLVPTLIYNGETIAESAIVAQFLADAHPSHLVLPSNAPGGALQRAQISFFVDAFLSKVQGNLVKFVGAKTDAEGTTHIEAYIEAAVKELEPLLKDAKPFFGGSDKLTLAEALTGSFIIRLLALFKNGVIPSNLESQLKEKAPGFYAWAVAVAAHPSVTGIFNEKSVVDFYKGRLEKLRSPDSEREPVYPSLAK
ncbi:unnamed protein product [Clonostachys rosea]|uniref:GST N-terminal domain-containing protein n=1 Tax=Bionectria ochroleuca TaxID=29856 RepID=A0ABY6UH59_BIOOC|nr:unnamed protein product [Clonostachys rosea]